MNVVLQSFNNISHFCEYLTQMPSLEGVAFNENQTHRGRIVAPGRARELSDALLAEELRKVLLSLSLGGSNGQAISPECLFLVIWKVVPRFRGYQQQDAHEFLTYMLDRLHTELLQLLPRLGHEPLGLRGKQSIVTAVFGGTLLSVVSIYLIGNASIIPESVSFLCYSDLGPLYELSYGFKDSRTIPRPFARHTGQISQANEGPGGNLLSYL